MQPRGTAERFSCIYHNWTYDHAGNLTNVAFRKGIGGKGGMPADANPESQSPKQLRVSSLQAWCSAPVEKRPGPGDLRRPRGSAAPEARPQKDR
jgi:phenylpropionate dioxygenase-like ring-hydroxylating dioxygenase large terminal subunit